jgi:CheY-like chemotaxis protein
MEKNRAVILEDEKVAATFLQELLEQNGFEVVSIFDNGEELLSQVEEIKPDILFADVMLAGDKTGIEVVKELPNRADICVVYITSQNEDAVIAQAKETLPTAFLEKPFDPNQLKSVINVSYHTFLEKRKEGKKLQKQNEMNQMQIGELMETQQHLVTATWRERELKDELQKTKSLIEEQNKKIMDSINYAKRIQRAIIPKHDALQEALGNYFMYYRPKDVVSGDFPYLYEREDYIYIAAVDCTGHGVPGAMMSLIGNLFLNDIVHNTK